MELKARMKKFSCCWRLQVALTVGLAVATPGMAAITVQDDGGNAVTLASPAQRVVTLAPHVTELVFAAGGGDKVVGRVSYSDYPPAARRIALVGDNSQIDMERLLSLKPDLIVVWLNGNTERQIAQLRQLGVPLFQSEPRTLDDIPASIVRLGQLLGTDKVAGESAAGLRRTLQSLRAQYSGRPVVRSFYQIAERPLYTLNGSHIVSDALRLCGGENIFAGLRVTAPTVTLESVLQADPEAIFGGAQRNGDEGSVRLWRAYPGMTAVKRGNLFSLDSDLVSRAGPRMIAGTAALCEKLELARRHRAATP